MRFAPRRGAGARYATSRPKSSGWPRATKHRATRARLPSNPRAFASSWRACHTSCASRASKLRFNSGNLSMDILNSVVFPPPYPGLPTEWLRNGTASPSSSSSDDGAYSSQDVSKAAGPSSADTQEQEKDASVPMESSAVNSMNSFALLSSVFLLASFVMSDY